MHLSGMLNVRVIMRMRKESWLRILERIVLPFFLNDHFPGDYVKALAEGKIEIVVQDTAHYGGIDEAETGSPVQNGYFSFLTRERSGSKVSANIPAKGPGSGPDVAAWKRTTITGNEKGLNIVSDQLSADNDSGYGAGSRSDEAPRVRRRIIKYACDQDADEGQRDFARRESHRRSWHDDGAEDYNDDIGETHWRGLASEPRRGSSKSTLRRSRSSSLSGSARLKMRLQRERRGSVDQKPQQRW